MPTQQISRQVDRQDDANREDANNNQQANYVTLEGQIVNSILATFLPDLFIPAGGEGGPVSQQSPDWTKH